MNTIHSQSTDLKKLNLLESIKVQKNRFEILVGVILTIFCFIAIITMLFVAHIAMRLKHSNKELSGFNTSLASMVKEATEDLNVKVEELSAQREKAEQATKAKSEFLANMSHEIRTPLNGIVGMAQILSRGSLDKKQHEQVKTIITSSDSLSTIINDILDFSKIEAGKIEIESVPLNLLELVENVVDQVTPLTNKNKNQLLIGFEKYIPNLIKGDPTRIRQILINLLSNANKFTKDGVLNVRAEIETVEIKNFIKVSVQDTGAGISEDKLDKIFEAFSQEDSSTTRHYGGTGLGLTISTKLSQLMGGEIGVKSKEGLGSTFHFTFPLHKAKDAGQYLDPKSPLSHIHPLIIDENEIRVRSLCSHFDSWQLDYLVIDDQIFNHKSKLKATINDYPAISCIIISYDLMSNDDIKNIAYASEIPIIQLNPIHSGIDETELFAGVSDAINSPIKPSNLMDCLASQHFTDVSLMAAEQKNNEPEETDYSNFKALLVDDTDVNRDVAKMLIEEVNLAIDMAEDGQQALDALAINDYDLIFMDCQMPVMDGYEATRNIRKLTNKPKSKTTIIAMTANAMKGDKDKCIEAGMDDYIAKPIRAEELYALLDKWLGQGNIVEIKKPNLPAAD